MAFRASDIKVRMATPQDSGAVKLLAQACLWPLADRIDWSDLTPSWVIAELYGQILATVQVCIGRPIGRTEHLFISPEASPRLRAALVTHLASATNAIHLKNRTQVVLSMVEFKAKTWKKLLKRHFGAQVLGQGNMMVALIEDRKTGGTE